MMDREETKRRIITFLKSGSQSLLTLKAKIGAISDRDLLALLDELISDGLIIKTKADPSNWMSEDRYHLL